MNKITAIFFLLFLLDSLNANAQDAADTAFEKTVFWQVSGDSLKDTSYLFGTAHPIFREDIHIAKNMLAALLKSKAVFFENIPGNNDDSLYKAINTMNKPRLHRLLGSICYDLLVDKLKQYNDTIINDPFFEYLTPQYFSSRISKHIFGFRLTAVDAILTAIAIGNDQPIFALDRKEFKEQLMEMATLDNQGDNLYKLLSETDKSITEYIKIIKGFTNWYNAGNIGNMYVRNNYLLINDRLSGIHLLRNTAAETILDKRNKEWMPKMEESMKKQNSFFAVGAAHLAGRDGLINLLRRKGYTVEPIFLEYKQKD